MLWLTLQELVGGICFRYVNNTASEKIIWVDEIESSGELYGDFVHKPIMFTILFMCRRHGELNACGGAHHLR